MKIERLAPCLMATALVLAGCAAEGGDASFDDASLDSNDQIASYGIGIQMGGQLADASDRIDRAAFMRGLEDGMRREDPDIDGQELNAALQQFGQEIQAAAAEAAAAAGVENQAEGEAFLAENGAREGVTTTESGLQYEVLRAGDGAQPETGQLVRLHYRGTLIDGTEFDSSYDGDPAEFSVGSLIPGFNEALTLMPVGSHYKIAIPWDIAYGPQARGQHIGPNETLIFEIELLEIVE